MFSYCYELGDTARIIHRNQLIIGSQITVSKRSPAIQLIVLLNFKVFPVQHCLLIFEGCRLGFYGIICDRPCPTNCKDNICHIVKGICFECKPGWIGILCKSSIILIFYLIY